MFGISRQGYPRYEEASLKELRLGVVRSGRQERVLAATIGCLQSRDQFFVCTVCDPNRQDHHTYLGARQGSHLPNSGD